MSLLDRVIEAQGGQYWPQIKYLKITLRMGGKILFYKLRSPFTRPLEIVISTERIYTQISPFPRAGLRGIFQADHLRIETEDGKIISERKIERDNRGQVPFRSIWDDLDLLYFLGYALWNYSMTPYLFRWPGFHCVEKGSWMENRDLCWQMLEVNYPAGFPTHCRKQIFYFDERGILQRLDYQADVLNSYATAAHYCFAHRSFNGLIYPTHRKVFMKRAAGRPLRAFSIMEGWIDDVEMIVPV